MEDKEIEIEDDVGAESDLPPWHNTTCTVYVSNLSLYATETQLWSLARMAGPVDDVIMGQVKETKEASGFAFITFNSNQDARTAVQHLQKIKIEEKPIRIRMDEGNDLESRRFCSLGQQNADGIFLPPRRPRKSSRNSSRRPSVSHSNSTSGHLSAMASVIASIGADRPMKRKHEE